MIKEEVIKLMMATTGTKSKGLGSPDFARLQSEIFSDKVSNQSTTDDEYPRIEDSKS